MLGPDHSTVVVILKELQLLVVLASPETIFNKESRTVFGRVP
jgi:hypothetical protein